MEADLDIAARTLLGEARGEPEAGQRAIAHVLVNRLKSKRWGPSLLSVCLWPWQFSCWNPSDPNRKLMIGWALDNPQLVKMAEFVTDVLSGEPDPVFGAMYYKVTGLPWPKDWGVEVAPVYSVGNHSFYILKE